MKYCSYKSAGASQSKQAPLEILGKTVGKNLSRSERVTLYVHDAVTRNVQFHALLILWNILHMDDFMKCDIVNMLQVNHILFFII